MCVVKERSGIAFYLPPLIFFSPCGDQHSVCTHGIMRVPLTVARVAAMIYVLVDVNRNNNKRNPSLKCCSSHIVFSSRDTTLCLEVFSLYFVDCNRCRHVL